MLPFAVAACCALATFVMPPTGAGASDTEWWTADSPADYAKAESRGVEVRPDGSLELGPRVASTPDDSLTTVWALLVMRDGSVAMAGDHGRIDRWTEEHGVRSWLRLPVGQVLSLAADGDGLVAGTGPEGLVYRIGAHGDTTRLARTGERYVWGLAPAGGGGWFAATGTRGRLLRVGRGKVETVFDSDESNLVSMIPDGAGGVYAGGDSKGKVLHVPAHGPARTVYDASEDEVRALALGADGALYAGAMSAAAASAGASPSATAPDDDDTDGTPGPSSTTRGSVGGRAVVYRIVPDSIATVYWTSPQPIVYALAPVAGAMLVATGNHAGVYRLERAEGGVQWLAAPQGQVTALVTSGERVFAATSNPAVLWRLGPDRAERGQLDSPTLDARRIARFGRLVWHGTAGGGRIELYARSGNSDPADSTWSEWRGGAAGDDGVRAEAPPARYFQWRVVAVGGAPHLSSVEASWREQNLPPRVEDVVVSIQGQDVREGELSPRVEPITQTLPGGQRVEYSLTPQVTAREVRDLPVWARGLRSAQWRGIDPNGDPLRYRLELLPEGRAGAIPLAKDVDVNAWTFDTHTLPDGRYRLRVAASDAAANPPGEEGAGDGVSAPFTVDNTPPEIPALEARATTGEVRVSGRAEDAVSALTRLEVAIDGEDWRPVTPEGGFADARRLSFATALRDVKPGAHAVAIRAVDASGNAATRAELVTVPGR